MTDLELLRIATRSSNEAVQFVGSLLTAVESTPPQERLASSLAQFKSEYDNFKHETPNGNENDLHAFFSTALNQHIFPWLTPGCVQIHVGKLQPVNRIGDMALVLQIPENEQYALTFEQVITVLQSALKQE